MKKYLQAVLLCQLLGYPSTELWCLVWSAFSLLLLQPLFLACLSRTDNITVFLDGLLRWHLFSLSLPGTYMRFFAEKPLRGFLLLRRGGPIGRAAQRDPQPAAAFPQCSPVLGWQLWLCFRLLHKYYFKGFWKGLGFFLMFHISISTKHLH